ncbi:MAG TPA: hypothetical protein DEF57_01265 [Candidatus Magasanikbacteria bacterium]|nr:hypothetical protein [Candidatus Magasanikbacteria bacterium]
MNTKKIGLERFFNSKEFKQRANNILLSIGFNEKGLLVIEDFDKTSGILIAGEKHSGKTTFLNCIIASLLHQNKSEKTLQFILLDSKKNEFKKHKDLPHLVFPIIDKLCTAKEAIIWLEAEFDRRFAILEDKQKRNIWKYNKTAKNKLPTIFFIVDELADLMRLAPKVFKDRFVRILQIGKCIGIFIIATTSKMDVKNIPSLVNVNFLTKVCFKTASGRDSSKIVYYKHAKNLKKGELLHSDYFTTKEPNKIHGFHASKT